MSQLQVVLSAERPDLEDQARAAFRSGWPEFIFHDPVSAEHIGRADSYFPQFGLLLLDGGEVVAALTQRAVAAGLARVIAPVRPELKSRYPLTPMQSFARWTRSDGLHIDPWLRTHQRLGAAILGPAPRSMLITGTVCEWESLRRLHATGRALPDRLPCL
ncbi:MAG: hypothetical protein ACLPUO_01535 [Streptosporangiaceae bacterium]|jgi:hypothetical protein